MSSHTLTCIFQNIAKTMAVEKCEMLAVSSLSSSPVVRLLVSALDRAGCSFNPYRKQLAIAIYWVNLDFSYFIDDK